MLNLTPAPKSAPKGPKRKKGQNGAKAKIKDRAILSNPKLIVYISWSQ